MRPWQSERWRSRPAGTFALRYGGAAGKLVAARLFGAANYFFPRQLCSGTVTSNPQTVPAYHTRAIWFGADVPADVLRTAGVTITATLEVFENGVWRTDVIYVVNTGTNHTLTGKDGTLLPEPRSPGQVCHVVVGEGGVPIWTYAGRQVRVVATFSGQIPCGFRVGGW